VSTPDVHPSSKPQLIEAATAQAPPGQRAEVGELLSAYVRHVAMEDLQGRSPQDVYGALASHRRVAQERPQGTACVRMLTPTTGADGWSAGGRSVLEIVVDDMPYLVDSVTMELARQRRDVHLVIHPVFDVVRDLTGVLQSVKPVADATDEPAAGAIRESWMHIEVDRAPEEEESQVVADLQRILQDVREAVEDAAKLRRRMTDIASELRQTPPAGIDPGEADEAAAFLAWLTEDHFTFLGYREYRLEGEDSEGAGEPTYLTGVPGTGLGILRADPDLTAKKPPMPAAVRAKARERTVLVLAKANSRATVSQPTYLDHVGVKLFDEHGEVIGERRFLGLLTTRATRESVTRIPVLRRKVAKVLRDSGFDPRSYGGRELLEILETYPRDELLHTPAEELSEMVESATGARERRTLRIFVRTDTYGRYVSVLVSLPRDRYSTTVRERFAQILTEELGGTDIEFSVRIGETTNAQVNFVVHVPPGSLDGGVDVSALERRLQAATRSWRDDLAGAVLAAYDESGSARLARFLDAFPEAYKEDFPATVGAADLARLEALGSSGVDFAIYRPEGGAAGETRLKVYRVGEPLSLSHVLPMLTSLGVEVTDERPYALDGLDQPTFVYDFGLRYPGGGDRTGPEERQEQLRDALAALWEGRSEVDGFNALVLEAGLTHRQVTVLRAYAKYLRQGGTPFSQSTIEAALRSNVVITRLLIELFEERFDPAGTGGRQDAIAAEITQHLEQVASLDQDRILRSYLAHIRATLRTNHWQTRDGKPKDYLALKLEPTLLPDLPQPRPAYEIFVYSPRVEGVHLRFGAVARGGLRWSDRRDDFRTEVLGLVKAQMVKNAVIVPVGAKGGFVPKQLPDPAVDREGWLREGQAAYVTFISGLLDLTDNVLDDGAGGKTVPPPDVVRHDGDDSYLVVAADKGTATFSDLANSVAKSYGFWLGDAFASGGSVGYDHKAMGITARGAWVSVQRHFRELGIDTQTQDFTAVGIGDMSGDVFGNGMLLSKHIRLVAAFDHRDIFIDPDPDPATSYAERRRLFELPRSSWQDYDRSLISEGGGVWSRRLKAVPVNDRMRAALGLGAEVTTLTPAALISAILKAPVDLLWNGGIGTYVKASTEPHSAAGDKTNDAVRVDGRELRARVVGEGGNLGLTQAGRVEYALCGGPDGCGGKVNTDAIDNSAGVDTSDHEVNLKILLDRRVAAGELTVQERNELLGEMTDEVAELVLHDNEEQNLALANAAAHAPSLLHVHEDWMHQLESRGVLDREVEGLPSTKEVRRRMESGGALTAPEHAVLMSWTKIELARELIDTDLPDDPYISARLAGYFPSLIRERFREAIEAHPLRREIVVTQVVNDVVNHAGKTFWPRLAAETGASTPDLVRAVFVAGDLYDADSLRADIRALDHRVDAAVQTRMRVDVRTLVERVTRWLVAHGPTGREAVERFRDPVRTVLERLPSMLTGAELAAYEGRRTRLVEAGVPEGLAARVATLPAAYALVGVVEVALEEELDPVEVTAAHLSLGERLGLPTVLARIVALPREDVWESMARASIRDDLHAVHAALTAKSLRDPAWVDSAEVAQAAETLTRIVADESADLARLSVALRVIRGLI